MAKKKAGARRALRFLEDNFIMIASLETKEEEGCTEKILNILKKHIKEIQGDSNANTTN